MIQRRDIAMCIILSIVTCGIYGIYWFICLADDTNTVSGNQGGTSGAMAFVLTLVTCGIYGFYWAYRQGEKIDMAKQQRGMSYGNSSGILYLILMFIGLGIVAYALMQKELNEIIDMNSAY